jgi:hypothetical protein
MLPTLWGLERLRLGAGHHCGAESVLSKARRPALVLNRPVCFMRQICCCSFNLIVVRLVAMRFVCLLAGIGFEALRLIVLTDWPLALVVAALIVCFVSLISFVLETLPLIRNGPESFGLD